jgi:hypothetical protein
MELPPHITIERTDGCYSGAGIRTLEVPLAYDVHPEFGYLCPAPRVRRELRVALVSILFGMAIGTAIVTIGAGQAVETDGVSSNAHVSSSRPGTLVPGVAGPSVQVGDADNARADPVEAIKPYPMRMVRMRSSKAAPPIAAIALGDTAPPEPDVGPASAGPALPEHAEGPAAPAVSPQTQSSTATVEPVVSRTKRRPSVMHSRRRRDDENETARWQNRRAPYGGERGYADNQYWHGAYRYWVD